MSRFYGTVQGNRGEASRSGHSVGGMTTWCASWNGAVRCYAYVGEGGIDCVRVTLTQWHGNGPRKDIVLYNGPMRGPQSEEAE